MYIISNIRINVLLWGDNNTNIFNISKSSAAAKTHVLFWSYLASA